MNKFATFCDDPHIACIKAQSEMARLEADNARLTAENAALRERLDEGGQRDNSR